LCDALLSSLLCCTCAMLSCHLCLAVLVRCSPVISAWLYLCDALQSSLLGRTCAMLSSHLCLAVLVYRPRNTRLVPLKLNSEHI
jgi:hypothetical protein